MVSPQPKPPSPCPKLPSSPNEATVVRYFGQICLPSSRGESFGDYCTKTRKGTSLSFWYKVYHASVFLCCKFERDQWSQRSMSRQKLLEASGRVGAILTTVASCGCPHWAWNSHHKCDFLTLYIFARLFWRARELLVKLPPASRKNVSIWWRHHELWIP